MNANARIEISELLARGISARMPREEVVKGFSNPRHPTRFFPNASKVSPSFEYSHELLLRTIQAFGAEEGLILDLGAGTGRLTRLVLERFSNCTMILSDVSEPLLAEAERSLSAYSNRISVKPGDLFGDLTFPEEKIDCVISAYAICHGRSEADYRGLYGRINEWIRPGGCFVCLDHVYGATHELTMLGIEDWACTLEQNFPGGDVERIIKHSITEDFPLSVPDHLRLLKDVGFRETDLLWKEGVFALYGGFGRA